MIALVAVTLGSAVQASVGLGLGLIAAPVLLLLYPPFVPGPLMASAIVMVVLVAHRDRTHIDFAGLRYGLAGRVAGTLAAGIFLAASQFPKNRETRAPLVKELLPHKSEIDPKYHFLLDAPVADPDGNPTVVRYSRKTKEQYVQTEVEGKPTGWRAFHDGKKWSVDDSRSKKAKR